ncbi:DUF3035 domain-containing protein [Pelagibacteraceae bacterium]|nr:DUF3035 domain-containing protein [Pelagibacteraceae bacterium]
MNKILILILTCSLFIVSCSKVRESAGVNRKSIDEFAVIENPPLVIPPDFNLLPPEQLEEKNLDKAESDLAKEILFGLEGKENNNNSEVSTMENILSQSNVDETDNSIRDEIDEQFASEKKSLSKSWDDEIEILDSIAESERIRNNLLNNEIQSNEEIPKVKVKNQSKKKKRFFFF